MRDLSPQLAATLQRSTRVVIPVVLIVGVVGAWLLQVDPIVADASASPLPASYAVATAPSTEAWAVFKALDDTATVSNEQQDIRLVGTFLEGAGENARRMAILDFLNGGRQQVVRESEVIEGNLRVQRIEEQRVVLVGEGIERILWRRGMGDGPVTPEGSGSDDRATITFESAPALETNRFGKKIAEDQWVLQREKLLQYYDELMAEPQRLAHMLTSFEEHAGGEEVEGFRINPQGEQLFFEALGLENDDVVRKVNSMRMVNQGRARFFLRQFMQDKVGTLVLDVEREGQMRKRVYVIR